MEVAIQAPPAAPPAPTPLRLLRIALVTETFLPKTDGIVTRLCHTIRHLCALGHQILIIAPRGVEQFDGARVHGVPGFAFPLYPELRLAVPRPSISRALRDFQPDLVHAINPAVLGVSAFFYTSMHRTPLVVSYHTHLPKYLAYYRLGMFEGLMWQSMRAAYNRADLTLATSAVMQQELECHGIRRVHLWRRGVDTDLFHPSRASRQMRARLTCGHPEDKLLLYIGRLSVEKEIERCRDVLAVLPGVRLALVGDGPHREKLERYFAGTPTFFAGFLRGEELASAYASGDAFLLASRTETLGLVLMEAMAAGCPVVAPRAGGVSDIIQEGVTGALYDPDRPADAVEAVARLLLDPGHRARMSRAARLDAEQWGWAAATRQLDGYYQEVMDREQRLPAQIAEKRRAGIPQPALCDQLAISRQTLRRHAGRQQR
ncbi:MAG TPA: glycosyltransferase family 1 protein [Acidobacteriaceae bacterium]|nr:glycosyltransferase family 1 protein [Acidobacteriaceae bacterium]